MEAHPCIELDVGAVLQDESPTVGEVRHVGEAADAAAIVHGPVM